jgi:hypothetical protein
VSDIPDQIERVSDETVLEAALDYFSRMLDIQDPDDLAGQLARTLGIESGATGLKKLVDDAAGDDSSAAFTLMRAALEKAAEHDRERCTEIGEALEATGRKQFVITGSMVGLGIMLVVAYLASVDSRVGTQEETKTVEKDGKGKVKITTKKKTTYVDPISSMGKILTPLAQLLKTLGD